MNTKLDQLIISFCPNGVEFRRLDEIFYTRNGYTPSKSNSNYWNGNTCIPWFRMEDIREHGNILFDSLYHVTPTAIKGEVFPEDSIIVATSATIGEHALVRVKSLANQRFTYLMLKDEYKYLYDIKFLYYYCYKLDQWCISHLNQSSFASVDMRKFYAFTFPIPPLEVQRKIVYILDNFTELTAQLTAELSARKKQYEYYRNKLLHIEQVPYFSLEELCEIVDYRGKTPRKVDVGIFLVTAKNIRKGYIDYEKSTEYIDESDYEEVMHRGIPQVGDVLITTEAPCGNVAQVDRENIALAQRVIKYRSKTPLLNNDYLKYILLGKEFQDKLSIAATGGTVKGIKGSKLHKLTIPVPDIERQKKIVNILKQFDVFCNDIINGLPAEIEARKKQYEYYRDKLLTFKELCE